MEMMCHDARTITLPPTNETALKHLFRNIRYGGKYKLWIATDVEGSTPTPSMMYNAPPLFPPYQIAALNEKGNYIVYWQQRKLPESVSKNGKYYYEILVNEGERTVNESTAKIFKTDQPPFTYKDVKKDKIYSFAVRVVNGNFEDDTECKFRSILSEVYVAGNPVCKYQENCQIFF